MEKKVLIIVAATLNACVSRPLYAKEKGQERQDSGNGRIEISGGALLETNISGFFHSGIAGGRSRMKSGISAGGFLNLGISRSFSVQGEMLVHYKHSDFEWGGVNGDFRYWGNEIAVFAFFHIPFKANYGQMYLGLGPYTEFGLEATYERDGVKGDLYEKDKTSGLPVLCDSNTGFAAKIGYEFACGFQIVASYKASFTNMLDANSSTVKMYPHSVSVGVAYRWSR